MRYLLLDIGNSRIKCSLSAKRKAGRTFHYEYKKDKLNAVLRIIFKRYKDKFDVIYVSSLDILQRKLILNAANGKKVNFIHSGLNLPINIIYARTLGSDRICSACGAYQKYRKFKNILIIDSGTAVTFNIISGGAFIGGMIGAGFKSTVYALLEKTTLPSISLRNKVNLINKSTKESMMSGLVFQHVFFIEKAIDEYRKLYKNIFVILTGGGSSFLGKRIKGIDRIEPNLVIDGLNYIALHNEII